GDDEPRATMGSLRLRWRHCAVEQSSRPRPHDRQSDSARRRPEAAVVGSKTLADLGHQVELVDAKGGGLERRQSAGADRFAYTGELANGIQDWGDNGRAAG